MKYVFILLIQIYRYAISPLLGSNCRFTPTCSMYALRAYQKYSLWKATRLTVSRISKCHPWSRKHGYDPLP